MESIAPLNANKAEHHEQLEAVWISLTCLGICTITSNDGKISRIGTRSAGCKCNKEGVTGRALGGEENREY